MDKRMIESIISGGKEYGCGSFTRQDILDKCTLALINTDVLYDSGLNPAFVSYANKWVFDVADGDINIGSIPVMIIEDDERVGSFVITREMAELLNIEVSELLFAAMDNLESGEFVIESLHSVIDECEEDFLYYATNKEGFYGASFLLRDDLIKKFAEEKDSDLIVIPSSIHEVIILPTRNADMGVDDIIGLLDIVGNVNENILEECDVLSDCLFYYKKSAGKLYLIDR